VALLNSDLETLSAEQQDLRVLLLSHLVADVFHKYGPAPKHSKQILRLMAPGSVQNDTRHALDRLLEVANAASQLRAQKNKKKAVKCEEDGEAQEAVSALPPALCCAGDESHSA
jgi:hypothetical protein